MPKIRTGQAPDSRVEVSTSFCGVINVFVRGDLSQRERSPFFLTVHDMGENASSFNVLMDEPLMDEVMQKSIWLNVEVPGQGPNAPDWPDSRTFPTLDEMTEDINTVCEHFGVKYCVGIGSGVGANILARYAIRHPQKLIGLVAISPTSTGAGFVETLKDKWLSWKLRSSSKVNPGVEQYLITYKFGSKIDTSEDEKDAAVEKYVADLRRQSNPRNLEKFMTSFLNRTDISGMLRDKLTTDVLVAAGSRSSFLHTTMTFYESCNSKRTSLLKVDDVGEVLNQGTGVLARSIILFVKGCGVLTSVSIPGIDRKRSFSSGEGRGRHPSMSEADNPNYYRRRPSVDVRPPTLSESSALQ